MTPEAKVKRVVTKQLKELGAYYFFPATGGYGRSGVPDIVGCWEGFFFAIECKAGRNKPTPLQERNLAEILEAGGAQLVANEDNAAGVTKWLEDWKRKRQLPEWYRSVVDVTEGE
tara:strand:+ start:2506 stop:2850 length:345 start_codon:yes stop_codon:yes gene_type:complete